MLKSVIVPEFFLPIFSKAEKFVESYFKKLKISPDKGTIDIDGERYILVRAASMSVNFLNFIKQMYPGIDDEAAVEASSKVLYDMAKGIGKSDAIAFHKKTGVTDPVEKLSTGPIHFAFTGWAFVEILPESHPSPDDDYFIVYNHPQTFEADAWLKEGKITKFSTCFMNAGYSTGWCEESFGVELEAKEVTCRSKGDKQCCFVMSRPHTINHYYEKYSKILAQS